MAKARSMLFAAFSFSVACLLTGCPPSSSSTVTVPDATKGDPTPPGTLWLQADVPGRPLGNATLNGAASTMDLGEPGTFTVTALGSDTDGGIREVRIFSDVTLIKGSQIIGPGLQSGPIAVTTVPGGPGSVVSRNARVQTKIDALAQLGSSHDIVVRLWAEAENFYGGIVRTPVLTVPSRLYRLRLLVIALADTNGTAAGNVTPANFATLVTRVNRSFEGTMIRFAFDPASDFRGQGSTVLNREQAGSIASGNAIVAAEQGRIPLLLRFGPDATPTGNGRGVPPLPPDAPAGHPVAPTWQQDFVWLPNSLNLAAATMLNLGDGSFVAHELGHYLGLYHTFPGWSDVGAIFSGTAPATAADADQALLNFIAANGGTVSAMDGDRIADTPFDPSMAFYTAKGVNPCTSPTIAASGTVNGAPVTFTFEPQIRNVMSYFPSCTKEPDGLQSPQLFTKDQIRRMQDTLQSPARRHLLPP
jgi:hypothetical protein